MSHRRPSRQTIAVLEGLAARPEAWRHGYDLSRETAIASGTLYPLLMRLCERGYLESTWEDSAVDGRPPRHLYRITTDGIAYLADQPAPAVRTWARPIEGSA